MMYEWIFLFIDTFLYLLINTIILSFQKRFLNENHFENTNENIYLIDCR